MQGLGLPWGPGRPSRPVFVKPSMPVGGAKRALDGLLALGRPQRSYGLGSLPCVAPLICSTQRFCNKSYGHFLKCKTAANNITRDRYTQTK